MYKNQISINLLANIIQFISTLIISFYFTPYIVDAVGVDAYGFYSIAGNFISYFSLITVAINSMASKYITIEWHKKNYTKVNQFFNTVLFSNLFISIFLSVFCVLIAAYLDSFMNIPSHLIPSVKLLFILVIFSGIITTVGSVFTVATFCENRLDLRAYLLIIVAIVRVLLLYSLFNNLIPNIYYLGISNLICSIIEIFGNFIFTKKLLMKIKISLKFFRKDLVSVLVGSGIWNSLNQVNTIIINGLDILLANLFLNPILAGSLAISKTIPNLVFTLTSMIGGIFNPAITIKYANQDKIGLREQFSYSFSLIGTIGSIIIAGFIVYGENFYALWLPSEDYKLIYFLSVLGMGAQFFTTSTQTIGYVEILTDKIRIPVLITFFRSIIGFIGIILINRYTDFGIYAIAGMSSLITIIYDLAFAVPYDSSCIGIEKRYFYNYKLKFIIVTIINIIGYDIIKFFIIPNSWSTLFVCIAISGLIGILMNYMLYLRGKLCFEIIKKKKGYGNV